MRVLAARFPDPERASAALDSLHRELDDEMKAEIAPLATAEGASTDTLLAGHFREEHKAEVAHIVEQAGGEIVADVDERWTRPRFRPGSSTERGYGDLRDVATSGAGGSAYGSGFAGTSYGGAEGLGAGGGGFGEGSGFGDEGGRGFTH